MSMSVLAWAGAERVDGLDFNLWGVDCFLLGKSLITEGMVGRRDENDREDWGEGSNEMTQDGEEIEIVTKDEMIYNPKQR